MKDAIGQNPTKDLVVHEGSDVSIDTQPEEERMQGIGLQKQLTNSESNAKGTAISKIKGSEANALTKDG